MLTNIEIDLPAIRTWFHTGAPGRWFDRLAGAVRAGAVAQVGFDAFTHDYVRYPKHLVEKIDWRREQGPRWVVFADQEYALAHHEGTAAHTIAPRRARSLVLRYPGLRIVLPPGKAVRHPGTKPNPYLREPLERIITRRAR